MQGSDPPPSALRAATSPSRGGFVSIAALPGMAERTIKIGSAGKIFSLTGWKVGWMVAAPELAGTVARAHQFLTFSTAPNLQSAVAFGRVHEVPQPPQLAVVSSGVSQPFASTPSQFA